MVDHRCEDEDLCMCCAYISVAHLCVLVLSNNIIQDGSSDEEEGNHSLSPMKHRSARHSVDAEIPDQLITHFYPVDDNYDPHPTDPTLRCPKSLTDLCGEFTHLFCSP